MKKLISIILFPIVLLFASCAGVSFDQDNTEYLEAQISELPAELLASRLVLNEKGQTLTGAALTVEQYIRLMVVSDPLMRNSWLSVYVSPSQDGAKVTLRQYNRGKLILENQIYLVYQNEMSQSMVEKIIWDDRLMNKKYELVTTEEKAEYALLISVYLVLQ